MEQDTSGRPDVSSMVAQSLRCYNMRKLFRSLLELLGLDSCANSYETVDSSLQAREKTEHRLLLWK